MAQLKKLNLFILFSTSSIFLYLLRPEHLTNIDECINLINIIYHQIGPEILGRPIFIPFHILLDIIAKYFYPTSNFFIVNQVQFFNIAISSLTAFVFYRSLQLIFNTSLLIPFLGFFLLLINPCFAFMASSALVDPLMNLFLIMAIHYLILYINQEHLKYFYYAAYSLGIAAAVKEFALVHYLVIPFIFLCFNNSLNLKVFLKFSLAAIFPPFLAMIIPLIIEPEFIESFNAKIINTFSGTDYLNIKYFFPILSISSYLILWKYTPRLKKTKLVQIITLNKFRKKLTMYILFLFIPSISLIILFNFVRVGSFFDRYMFTMNIMLIVLFLALWHLMNLKYAKYLRHRIIALPILIFLFIKYIAYPPYKNLIHTSNEANIILEKVEMILNQNDKVLFLVGHHSAFINSFLIINKYPNGSFHIIFSGWGWPSDEELTKTVKWFTGEGFVVYTNLEHYNHFPFEKESIRKLIKSSTKSEQFSESEYLILK